jgi:hypothetical protein
MNLMEWLQLATAGGAFGALGLAAAAFLKTRPAMKQAQIQGEAALWAEVHTLRAELKREREECDKRIDRIEERHLREIADLKGELSVQRHDRNNIKQAFNFVIISMRRMNNEELSGIAEAAEEMMHKGDEVVAKEKGALRGARA